MVTIIFEAHSTSVDNETHLASGWFDVPLSELGERQSIEFGQRYKEDDFAAIFCSDLQRSCKTAEIAFANRSFPVIKDARLRECNYGDLTRRGMNLAKEKHITEPFPNGESYEQTSERVKSFLADLLKEKEYEGKKVMIIGHRATQYGLEHWIKRVPLSEVVTAPWKWQPGWIYQLESI